MAFRNWLANQDYATLKKKHLEEGKLFEDGAFVPKKTKDGDKFVLKRPKDICETPKFIVGGLSRSDTKQGDVGDCWMVAAIASLTLKRKIIARVVPNDQTFDEGDYCGIFRFRFYQFGKWVEVVIDDRLPCTLDSDGTFKLMFTSCSNSKEFWVPLLEKAYAKFNGSYDALDGGQSCDAIVDFTGGLTEYYELHDDDTTSNLFSIMKEAFSKGSIAFASTKSSDNKDVILMDNGLVYSHAYSVTYIDEPLVWVGDKKVRQPLLRLRNPWGDQEWNGPWSDESDLWKTIVDDKDFELKFGLHVDEGEFWIAFEDLKKHFVHVQLCSFTPDLLDDVKHMEWYERQLIGNWVKDSTAGGSNESTNYASNPQFFIQLKNKKGENCTILVDLMHKRGKEEERLGMSFHIYALKVLSKDAKGRPQRLTKEFFTKQESIGTSSTLYNNFCGVNKRFTLPPGIYVIIPSTEEEDQESKFLLRLWTKSPAKSFYLGEPGPEQKSTFHLSFVFGPTLQATDRGDNRQQAPHQTKLITEGQSRFGADNGGGGNSSQLPPNPIQPIGPTTASPNPPPNALPYPPQPPHLAYSISPGSLYPQLHMADHGQPPLGIAAGGFRVHKMADEIIISQNEQSASQIQTKPNIFKILAMCWTPRRR